MHPSFQRCLPSRQNASIIGALRQDKEDSAWKTHSNKNSPPGAQPIGTFFDTASVSLMECLGRTGLDFAIIDNEHSPIEAETTAALVPRRRAERHLPDRARARDQPSRRAQAARRRRAGIDRAKRQDTRSGALARGLREILPHRPAGLLPVAQRRLGL